MKKIFKKLGYFFGLFCGIIIISLAYGQNSTSDAYNLEAKEHYKLGNALYEQGKYAEAGIEFQEALELLSQRNQTPAAELSAMNVTPIMVTETQITQPAKPITESRNIPEYLITEADELKIAVWQNPDLDQEVVVRLDGRISFPLVGDVMARGLTISQFDQELTKRLSEFIKVPEVSVSLKKMGGKKVVVLGEVTNPGVYSVSGTHTALQAIGLAGGFTRDSVPSSTVLIRGGFEKPQAKRFNLSSALKGNLSQNPVLLSEDIIFVPKKFIANVNYFLEQVLEPLSRGAYLATELGAW